MTLIFFSTTQTYGQRDGGAAGEFLRWGIGGRAMSMGRAFVGQADDASAPYWNPAGLAYLDQIEVSLMSTYLYNDVHYHYLGMAWPLKERLTLGANVIGYYVRGIQNREMIGDNLVKSGDFTWGEMAALYSLGYRVLDWPTVEVGLTYKRLYRKFDYSDETCGWDFGLRVRLGSWPLFLGFQVQNFNWWKFKSPELGYDTFPYLIRSGLSYTVTDCLLKKRWILNFDVDGLQGVSPKHFDYKAGIDLAINQFLSIRAGGNYQNNHKWEWTAGIGLAKFKFWQNLSFDYSVGRANELGYEVRGKGVTPRTSFTIKKQNSSYFKELYDEAKDKCWRTNRGKYLFHKIIDKGCYEPYAVKAIIRLGDMAFEEEKYAEALDFYSAAWTTDEFDENEIYNFFKHENVQGDSGITFSYFNYLESLTHEIYFNFLKNCLYQPEKNRKKNTFIKTNNCYGLTSKYYDYEKNAHRYFFDRILVSFLKAIINENSSEIQAISDSLKLIFDAHNSTTFDWRKAVACFNYGICLMQLDRLSDAKSAFNQIIQKYENRLPVKSIDNAKFLGLSDNFIADDAQLLLGICYLKKKNYEQALLTWAKIPLLYPESDVIDFARSRISNLIESEKFYSQKQDTLRVEEIPEISVTQSPYLAENLNYPFQMVKDDRGNTYISIPTQQMVKIYDKQKRSVKKPIPDFIFPWSFTIANYRVETEKPIQLFVFVADAKSGKIKGIAIQDKKYGFFNHIDSTTDPLPTMPVSLINLSDTTIMVANARNNKLSKHNTRTTKKKPVFVRLAKNDSLQIPNSITINKATNKVYVADWGNRRIAEFISQQDTLIFTQNLPYPQSTGTSLWFPLHLAVSNELNQNYLYVLYQQEPEAQNNLILKYDLKSNNIEKLLVAGTVFSFFIEKEETKPILYLVDRKKNGKIIKIELE